MKPTPPHPRARAARGLLLGAMTLPLALVVAAAQTSTATVASTPAAAARPAGDPPADAAGVGTVRGTVTDDTTKLALAGVRVSVPGTDLETYTDQEGDYFLVNVPSGTATIVFSYVGYPTLAKTVSVAANQANQLNVVFGLGETVKLAEFRITGEAVGSARAINLERSAPTLTNIVAADAIGQLPDKNIAEALARVPDVDLYRDKGEGRFVEIRGIDPVWIGVDINGIPASTTEKGTREVTLDVISSDMIAAMDVSKVVTPEMDAAMGGSVNIKTRSGFDQEGPQAMLSAGTNWDQQEDRHGGYNLAGYYGDQYFNGKLGVFIGVVGEYRPFTVYNTEEVDPWELVKSPTTGQNQWLFGGQDFRHYDVGRHRQGLDGSLDYKFSDTETAYVRYTMSYYTERDNYWVTETPFQSYSSLLALTDTSATAVIPAKDLLKEGAQVVNGKISTSLVGGLNSKIGPFTNHFEVGYTLGKYTRPTIIMAFANTSAMTMSYAFSDPWHDTYSQVAGPNFNDPTQYAFSTKSSFTNTHAGTHAETVKDDLRDDFQTAGLPSFLQVGVEYRNTNTFEQAWKDNITSLPFTFASAVYPGPDTQYQLGGFASPRLLPNYEQLFYAQPNEFPVTENVASSDLGSFQALEDVGAIYAEYGLTLGKLKILAGPRLENTHFWIEGWQEDVTTGALSEVFYTKNYADFMPDVIFTYEFTPKTIARASWTNTLARPDYGDTIPGRQVDDVNHLVTQGNPEMAALHSTNYDASLEHYFSTLGMVEAALYYKSVNNYPFQAESGIDPSTGYLLSTYYTAPTAWVDGIEFAARQRFGFLPAPLDGLGIAANASFGDSRVNYPTRPGENLGFIGFAHTIYNVALTYEKNGLKFDLAVNHHSPRIEVDSAIGSTTTTSAGIVEPAYSQDQYEDSFTELDFGSSYNFLGHWQIYFNASNLTNAPLREYEIGDGSFKRLEQYERYGPGFEAGLRWNL